jgi:dephospho-CoA kinase
MARVTVLIGEQRSQWEEEFEALAARLHVALGRLALRIDHIGSTSVKGLPAKDVIDVQVVVHRLEPFEDLAEAFARAGFTRRAGDWNLHDHQPAGWIGPASDWEKLCGEGSRNRRPPHRG